MFFNPEYVALSGSCCRTGLGDKYHAANSMHDLAACVEVLRHTRPDDNIATTDRLSLGSWAYSGNTDVSLCVSESTVQELVQSSEDFHNDRLFSRPETRLLKDHRSQPR